MSRELVVGLMLFVPAALGAQQGTIAYAHSVRLEIEIPEAMRARLQARGREGVGGPAGRAFPNERVDDVVLIFNDVESLMKPVPRAAGEEGRGGAPPEGGRLGADGPRAGVLRRLRLNSVSRAGRETLVEAHTRFAEGAVVESREFLGRTFLIEDERPAYAWKLSGEQAEFLGYVVQKATAVRDSMTVEAWFTPQIPVPGGPGAYGGLPGMILVVSVDEGREQYTATEVVLTPVAAGVIVPPTEGDAVTREEYEKIVEEKLEELRMTGRRIRR